MLAAHRDQENLAHEHQTAAAAKPLNQSLRGLGPKTPGNNGKVPLKSAAKGDENTIFVGGAKTTKASKNAFMTPVAPRERAPLGAKTTNAKATAFQTPAPLTGGQGLQKTQRPSASSRKHKLKIHQPEAAPVEPATLDAEADAEESDDDIPDIEYCPPKITELPDIPDDPNAFGPDTTFPQFQNGNATRGWFSTYCNPIGEDGLSKLEREARDNLERARALSEQTLMESMEREFNASFAMADDENVGLFGQGKTLKSMQTFRPAQSPASTLNAKSAAAALSKKTQPSYAAPTAAARARNTTTLPVGAASRRPVSVAYSTIGYSKGRKVSSSLRQQRQPADSQSVSRGEPAQEKPGDLIHGLMQNSVRNDNEDDDDELVFPSSRGRRDVFDEEASRPFVLRLPDYDE